MQTFKTYLTEGQQKVRTMTLYHGVRDSSNVKRILDKGFSLFYIKPRWVNDFAVSAAKSKKNVIKFFGNSNIVVLKFKFRGNVWKGARFETLGSEINSFANTPVEFTRAAVQAGIDASDQGHTVFIYNLKKISNIEIA
ncbi:MAG: hypothetical protein DRP51_06050 [Candidatus Zixiibacteriota bacterium]|nr:MAG: hypothetical protein DRP51_06050 [candidate division Zixibacteria bacterium]